MRLGPRLGKLGGRFAPLALSVAACAGFLALDAGRAEAQYGFGGGFYNFHYTPQEVSFLNSRSLEMTNKATMGNRQNNAYAGNPNAYVNHLHDDGYLQKYDAATQRSIESSIGRYSEVFPPAPRTAAAPTRPAPAPAAPAAPTPPSLPLASFFDRYTKLVWPEDAPVWGALKEKRQTSDLATLAVLNEYNLQGLASVSNVTQARTKLLDYGRPALQYMRENATPRIADGFHLFLLSLYESIGQAATNPKPAAAPAATTPPATAPAAPM
jgi:hypothetical protein